MRDRVFGWAVVVLGFGLLGGCFQCCYSWGQLEPLPQAKRYHDQGMAFLAEGRPDKAVERFELALKIQPLFVPSQAHLGYACYKLGRYDRAIQELNNAVESLPDYADSYNYLALVYEAKNDLQRAEEHYRLAIDTLPSYADAYYNRGRFFEKQHRYQEALRDYEAAATYSSQSDDATSKLMMARANTAAGLLYVRNGVLKDAKERFLIAIDTEVVIPEAHLGLGRIRMQRELWDEAIIEFHEALKTDPKLWYSQEDVELCKRALATTHKRAPNRVAKKLVRWAKERYDKLNRGEDGEYSEEAEVVLKEVRRLLYSASKIDPKLSDTFILQARIALDQGKIKLAGSILTRKVLAHDKRNKDARYLLAVVYVARARDKESKHSGSSASDWRKAQAGLRTLRRWAPKEFKYHELLGTVYFAQELLRKAEREWREALRCEASEAEKKQTVENLRILNDKPVIKKANDLNAKGIAQLDAGSYEKARDYFKQALLHDPAFAVARANLALSYLEEGNLQVAISEVASALKLDPDLHSAHIIKGRIFMKQKRMKEARAELEEARRLYAYDPEVYYQLARLEWELDREKPALAAIREGLAISPEHPAAQVLAARIHKAKKRYDLAETHLKAAITDSEGNYSPAFVALGELMNELGRYEEAMEYAEHAYSIEPEAPAPWLVLAEAFEGQHKRGEAANALLQAVDRFEAQGEVQRALAVSKRAVKLAPNSSDAYDRYGLFLAATGRFDEAIQNLRVALQHDPDNLRAWFDLGTVYEQLGEPKLAADAFRKVMAGRPVVGDAKNPMQVQVFVVPRYRLANLYKPGRQGPVSRSEAIEALEQALPYAQGDYRVEIRKLLRAFEN